MKINKKKLNYGIRFLIGFFFLPVLLILMTSLMMLIYWDFSLSHIIQVLEILYDFYPSPHALGRFTIFISVLVGIFSVISYDEEIMIKEGVFEK